MVIADKGAATHMKFIPRNIICLCALTLTAALPYGWAAPIRGGTNYAWWKVDGYPSCNRVDYYVISNYKAGNVAFDKINAQLQKMFNQGQRTIRIPVFHARGGSGGSCLQASNNQTSMDSTGGDLAPQCRANFAALLAKIKNIGFQYIEVGFFPDSVNSAGMPWPDNWCGSYCGGSGSPDPYYEGLFQENWNLIVRLRPIITQNLAGAQYRIDLWNEGAGYGIGSGPFLYAQRLWGNYTSVYGKNDTVGFSLAVDPANVAWKIGNLNALYGAGNAPYIIDVHIGTLGGNDQFNLSDVHTQLANQGISSSLIIGETFFNDAQKAQELSAAAASFSASRTVWWLTQWPNTQYGRGTYGSGNCGHVDVPMNPDSANPFDFQNFLTYGW